MAWFYFIQTLTAVEHLLQKLLEVERVFGCDVSPLLSHTVIRYGVVCCVMTTPSPLGAVLYVARDR